MFKRSVLIAEDDPVLRNLYQKKFSIAQYDIRTAENGEEVLQQLDDRYPDVLVLDIHMPKMDGFDVLEKLSTTGRPFPVIMLTNFADERSRERSKELGANGYFVKKDMTIRALLDTVDRAALRWKELDTNA